MKKILLLSFISTLLLFNVVISQDYKVPNTSWHLSTLSTQAFLPMGGSFTYDKTQLSTYIVGTGLDFWKSNPNPYRGWAINFATYFMGVEYTSLVQEGEANIVNWVYARIGPRYNTSVLFFDVSSQIGYGFVLNGRTEEKKTYYQHGFDLGITINLKAESIPIPNYTLVIEGLDRIELNEGDSRLFTGYCPGLAGKDALLTLRFSCNLIKSQAGFTSAPKNHARTIHLSINDQDGEKHENMTTDFQDSYGNLKAKSLTNGMYYDKKLDVELQTKVEINREGYFVAYLKANTLRWGDKPEAKLLTRKNAIAKVIEYD